MTFTMDNTEGFTVAELAALNVELSIRLAQLEPDDIDGRAEAEKAFSDEVARR